MQLPGKFLPRVQTPFTHSKGRFCFLPLTPSALGCQCREGQRFQKLFNLF